MVRGQTLADFRRLPEGTLVELIGGHLVFRPTPLVQHRRVVGQLVWLLGDFVESRDLGVVVSWIDTRLSDADAFQPDLVFVSHERLGILGEQEIEGAPDLVVEVLSPSTGYYDLTQKREAYERAGVREYWIVDPERQTVEVLTLDEGAYRTAAKAERAGRIGSVLLEGFETRLERLFLAVG